MAAASLLLRQPARSAQFLAVRLRILQSCLGAAENGHQFLVRHPGSEASQGIAQERLRRIGVEIQVLGPGLIVTSQAANADSTPFQIVDAPHGAQPPSPDAVDGHHGGLLKLLDLPVEGTPWWSTLIDRLSRELTYGLQVIEGLHHAGVEFRSLAKHFDTATANGKLQLQMVLAFSEWWRNSIRDRSVADQAKARTEGRFPSRRSSLTEQQREYIREERSKGVSHRELAKRLEVSRWTIQQVDG